MEDYNPNPITNENLKVLIGALFIFLGVIFFYFLGWHTLEEGKIKAGIILMIIGIYFLTALFWMFKSMKRLYIATAIPFSIITGYYLIYMW